MNAICAIEPGHVQNVAERIDFASMTRTAEERGSAIGAVLETDLISYSL